MPAVMPALVQTSGSLWPAWLAAGSRTKMRSGCRRTAGWSAANWRLRDQCVVAVRWSSRPAAASTRLPLQMLAMRAPDRLARCSQPISGASRQAASTPSPPITITRSIWSSRRGSGFTGQCTPAELRTAGDLLATRRQV